MYFLWLLLLEGHDTQALLSAGRDTRFCEVTYPPDFIHVVAAQFATADVLEWLATEAPKPAYMLHDPEVTEVPMIIAKDSYSADLAKDPSKAIGEPGPRIGYSVQHPAPIEMGDTLDVQSAEGSFEKVRSVSPSDKGTSAYDPRRTSIWCIAAPGVAIDIPMEGKLARSPKIGIVRVQDNALIPAPGERFELGKYMRTNVWMLMRGIVRYEVLTNPSPETMEQLYSPVSQIIEARERPDGVDILVRSGTHRAAFGFKVSVNVDPKSDKDRFWYGIEQEGNGPMRVRVVTSGNVAVKLAPLLQEGHEPPKSWWQFWSAFAYSTYLAAEGIRDPQMNGPSNGYSGGLKFREWIGNILTVSLTSLRINYEGLQHLLAKLNHAIGAVGDAQQVRALSSPFFVLERCRKADPAFHIPPPSLKPIGMDANEGDHPLAAIADKLETGHFTTDGAAGTIIAGVTDLPQPLAEMAAAMVVGVIPLVGDAFDLVDGADLIFNNTAPDGTDPEAMDYLGLGVFALVSGASTYAGLKKTLTGTRRGADYAAIVKHLEKEAQFKLRELDDMVAGIKQGKSLDEGAIRKLTRLLTDLSLDDAVPGMRAGYVFDDLIGNSGFKHPWVESVYRKSSGDAADDLTDVAAKRKAWLRSLPEDNDVRRLITASLGEKLAKLEFLSPPAFNPNSQLGLVRYRQAVDEYVELHRMLSADRFDALESLGDLSRSDLEKIAQHHGPNGLGLEFDYNRFPIENLEKVAPDIVGEFRPGMPINWPLERKVYIGSTQGEVLYLGLQVPGYRGSARIERSGSRVAYEVERAVFSSNQAVKWRIDGNLLFYEKLKRHLDPDRASFIRSKRDYSLPKGYDPANPGATDWNALEKGMAKGGWYKAVEDRYNPIAEIPDDMLQFQLHRHQFSPPSGRASGLPPRTELDHEFIPQRVFYDLGLRGLVRDEVLKDMTRSVVPADEIEDWLSRMASPEYQRAIRLRNELNAQLGQTSGRRLIAKHRTVHSEKDAYAASGAVSHVMARLDDETFMRDMAHVPIDTLRLMAREAADPNVGAIAPYLRWSINQEFSVRNLKIDDLPGAKIPRDFRRPLDEYLQAVKNGMDPDPPIKGYPGRQLPTAEDHDRYIRMGRYDNKTPYDPTY